MKKLIFLFLLSISVSTFSQEKDTNNYQQVQNIQFVLTGTVIDSETSERLEYATITLKDKRNQEKVFGGISDDNGNFSIKLNPGIYDLSIDYISFVSYRNENLLIAVIFVLVFLIKYFKDTKDSTRGENPINFIFSNNLLLFLSILIILSSLVIYIN